MVDLTKLFTRCDHCQKSLAQPMYVCPWCNWPRDHTEETPPPSAGLPDLSFKPGKTVTVQAAPQQAGAIPKAPELIDIPLAGPPIPQAPSMNPDALPDLGTIPPEFGVNATPIEVPPVEPVTLMPEVDATVLAAQAAERRSALQALIDAAVAEDAVQQHESPDTILAGLSYTPKPTTKRKK